MGLLTEGSPLTWEETKQHANHVRKHGIKQFLNQYKKLRERTKDVLYWGDEVEYALIKFDHETKRVRLLLKTQEVLGKLAEKEKYSLDEHKSTWHPEYADYMVEGIPGRPYGCTFAHFNLVEANMKLRKEEMLKVLGPDEHALSITSFPRFGCGDFTVPHYPATPNCGISHSLFIPDQAINSGHPRFRTLTRNIRERRNEKVAINIPIFKDKNTPDPFVEDFSALGDDGEAQRAALPDHVYMDCMCFGMGCCCLQVTFQACNIDEGRLLYDQLAALCPIFLALSAATPYYRGLLCENDTRWPVISQAVDDRTREERGLEPLENYKFHINKSRFDSIDSYLSPKSELLNDISLVYDKEIYQQLIDGGVDSLLAKHMAHLFIRDPISLFSERIDQNDEEDTDHFENIQSTNWQTMRFKPPPPNSDIGWRVEFRPMEAQLSDFENAAYCVFIVLLTRVILTYKLNFLIPISRVDENMKTAYKRDAVTKGKFYFKKDVVTEWSPAEVEECLARCSKAEICKCIHDEYRLMDINEIINGTSDFVGLLPLMNKYMDTMEIDVDTRCTVLQYLCLISKRASGELKTTASWIREFVQNHPEYKHDSVVSDRISYDLLVKCADISQGKADAPDLLFSYSSKSADDIPAALAKAQHYLNAKISARGKPNAVP